MFTIFLIFAVVFFTTFNATCLRFIIEDGKMNHHLFTRSIRMLFLIPPLAILVISYIVAKDSLMAFLANLKFISSKRKD